jgi:hypothetical protein
VIRDEAGIPFPLEIFRNGQQDLSGWGQINSILLFSPFMGPANACNCYYAKRA